MDECFTLKIFNANIIKGCITNNINHRPRKSLGYKTPFEVFMKGFANQMAQHNLGKKIALIV